MCNLLAACSCGFGNTLQYQQPQLLERAQVSGLPPWPFAHHQAWLGFCRKKVILNNSLHPLFVRDMAKYQGNLRIISVLRFVTSSIPCCHFNHYLVSVSWPCTSYAISQHELHWVWFHLHSLKTETRGGKDTGVLQTSWKWIVGRGRRPKLPPVPERRAVGQAQVG